MNAPISSPSASASASASSSTGPSTRQSPTGFQAAQTIAMPPPAQAKCSSTEPFLRDLNLVAEAAKRAQVAVMVRDFDNCALS